MIKKTALKTRAVIVGICILAAYSMLSYDITKNIAVGVITDIISGIAVITIAVLLFPVFDGPDNNVLNKVYLITKTVEGLLMIVGGVVILSSQTAYVRGFIYSNIHIYFFIAGAVLFYLLFYRTQIVPWFLSVWGLSACAILFIITVLKLLGVSSIFLDLLLLPMIVNEIFLAVWLMIKGFDDVD